MAHLAAKVAARNCEGDRGDRKRLSREIAHDRRRLRRKPSSEIVARRHCTVRVVMCGESVSCGDDEREEHSWRELGGAQHAVSAERAASGQFRIALQSAEDHIHLFEVQVSSSPPNCRSRCAKLEDLLDEVRKEPRAMKLAAEKCAREKAEVVEELKEARKRIDSLRQEVATRR